MTAGVILGIALAVFVGAFVQAVVGLGVGLVAAPVVAALEPQLMPVLPLFFGLLASGLSLRGEWHAVNWPAIGWSLPARIPGTALGVWLVVIFTSRQIAVAVGVMVLVAVALSLATVSLPITRTSLVGAGFASGVTGTATSIGGPPIALLFQRRPPAEVRATLSVFFFVGVVLGLGGLLLAGEVTWASVQLAALLAPVLLAGVWCGWRVRDRVPREQFRTVVLAVCTLSALALLARSLS